MAAAHHQPLGAKNSEVTVLELGLPLVAMIAANAIMSTKSDPFALCRFLCFLYLGGDCRN